MIVVSKTTRTLAKVLMQEARNVYIYGPPGSGKSEFCAEIAEELGLEYITVSFSGESSIDDLLGYMSLQQGESGVVTQPVDGALVKAAKRGCVLICEEIDAAPPSALIVLHKALDTRRDGSRSFYNPLSHETIEAKEGFCVWATANTAGSGDIDGRYAGTLIQNQAFLDRFYFLKFDYLNPRSEAALLKKLSGVDDTIAKALVKFATDIRTNQLDTGLTIQPPSTRTLLRICEVYKLLEESPNDMTRSAILGAAIDCGYIARESSPEANKALKTLAKAVITDGSR